MSLSCFALVILFALSSLNFAEAQTATHPFESPKYGVKIELPDAWTLAETEKEDRVFVALLDGKDPKRPGAVVCELGLAPESLDDFRTRIDGNAQRNGRRGGKLISNKVVKVGTLERLETLWEFRPGFGGVWHELTIRMVANRQLYSFILNADEDSYPNGRPLFEALVGGAKLTPPNTGAERLTGNRWLQTEFKFSLDLPEKWSPVLAPSEVALFYANTKAKGVWADNVLVLAHEHRPLDLKKMAQSFPEQLRAAEPNCEVISCKVIKRNQVDALETIVRTKRGPFSMTVFEHRFKGERFDYEIKYSVESERFDALLPAIRKSVESFKEIPGTVPRPGKGKDA